MKIENLVYENNHWNKISDTEELTNVNLVTVFGDIDEFANEAHYHYLRKRYPEANIIGCSSSRHILGQEINTNPMVATAVSFDDASTVLKSTTFNADDDITTISYNLAKTFDEEGLKHIFILTDGLKLNGAKVIQGFNEALNIPLTGGMAADSKQFVRTLVMANAPASECTIAAVGFYGENLEIGYGSVGGWSEFGTPRTITKSKENIVYELDGEPVLDYYKRYLNTYSDNLQEITFQFPFGIKKEESDTAIIRAALGINEEDKSIIMAGDMPQGYTAQLMKPDMNMLIEGAGKAAENAKKENSTTSLALAVSCTARIIVLDQISEEEIEEVAHVLGEHTNLVGFYSYGEIAPFENDILNCKLHNQTMTITTIYEK